VTSLAQGVPAMQAPQQGKKGRLSHAGLHRPQTHPGESSDSEQSPTKKPSGVNGMGGRETFGVPGVMTATLAGVMTPVQWFLAQHQRIHAFAVAIAAVP